MKTIPESIQNCNHWLQNRNTTQILNPSNSTDLENRQNSSAFPYAKTLGLNPSNSMGLRFKQKPLRTGLAASKRHTTYSNWNALRTELSRIHSSSLFRVEDETTACSFVTNECPVSLSLRGGLQPDEAIYLPMRLLRRYAPRNDVFKSCLQSLVGEISLAKSPLIPAHQLAEVYRDQLSSPEAIAERFRPWASSAVATTADYQPEVEV